MGKSKEIALIEAQAQLPKDVSVIETRLVREPKRRTIDTAAEDEASALRIVRNTLKSTELVETIRLTQSRRAGFLGIGSRLPQFSLDILDQAVVEIRFRPKAHLKVTIGYKNRGDYQSTLNKAVAYWMARMQKTKKDPFALYIFSKEADAKRALLELPCIKEDEEDGLICTEVLFYGVYRQSDGNYEAVIGGDDLTVELWEQAKEAFEKHGGERKNELRPTKAAAPQPDVPAKPEAVVFVREETAEDGNGTYRIFRAPDAISAKTFLDGQAVSQPLYYLMVETPEGVYCRDIGGMYKEASREHHH